MRQLDTAHARKSDPQTSKDAAASVVNLGRLRNHILKLYRLAGWQTDEQLIVNYRKIYGAASLASDSGIRSRRSELVKMGLVEKAGIGKTASGRACQIWKLK